MGSAAGIAGLHFAALEVAHASGPGLVLLTLIVQGDLS